MLNLSRREPLAAAEDSGALAMPEEILAAVEEGEFEIVLGKRQLASVLFVAVVILVVFAALSYLAGKAASPKKAEVAAPAAPALQATIIRAEDLPKGIIESALEPNSVASLDANPAAPAGSLAAPEQKVFADPAAGSIYIQMGAVEKGIAVIFAEGLRKHGFDAFVAPGPNEKIFRVLIGPVTDHDAYLRVKDNLDAIGLSTFVRRYRQDAPQASGPAPKSSSGATDHAETDPATTVRGDGSGAGEGRPRATPLLSNLVNGPGLAVHVVH